ncbi:formylglycine-generating enzyme family protein [Chthonobacter rhizosphaerae]|uniref:formylglycine-generating enzyme family protein n=1 Tax=Chthonobacter rhizosphaerae TaxID=2735553 RepID=UPI0015EEE143|nr:SUMF1/EgtB/PvdO family nonheme iron enzyme [Chthonobacter rhizosphaerae]
MSTSLATRGHIAVVPSVPALALAILAGALVAPALAQTTGEASGGEAGETVTDCDTCPTLVRLPDGSLMGRDLVTRAEFAAFASATGFSGKGCHVSDGKRWSLNKEADWQNPTFPQGDDHPVVCVSWDDANAYADWLSERTGKSWRLPTVEESQAATAAGSTSAFWWGEEAEDICARVNLADQSYKALFPLDERKIEACDDGFAHTAPVGSFPANAWALNDMAGNVWQWTNSCLKGDCANAVFRGAGWNVAPVKNFTTAHTWGDRVVVRSFALGFRLMRNPD